MASLVVLSFKKGDREGGWRLELQTLVDNKLGLLTAAEAKVTSERERERSNTAVKKVFKLRNERGEEELSICL